MLMTEDSSFPWRTKRRRVYRNAPADKGLEFVRVFGHDAGAQSAEGKWVAYLRPAAVTLSERERVEIDGTIQELVSTHGLQGALVKNDHLDVAIFFATAERDEIRWSKDFFIWLMVDFDDGASELVVRNRHFQSMW